MSEPILTQRELNRALLARQLLLERKRLPVARAVEQLCALQAQYSPSPYIALWSRLDGFSRDALTRALERRSVVKASLFRITLHLVSARDYAGFAAMWVNAYRTQLSGITPEQFDELGRRLSESASGGPITLDEVHEVIPELEGQWRVRTLAPLVHVPPSGTWGFHGKPSVVAAPAWLDGTPPGPDDGATLFVRRYLSAFGPATREDLIRFAGVRVRDVRPGLDAFEPELRQFRDEKGRLLLDLKGAPLPDGDTPAPVRLLPKWDSALLAYAPPERTRILPERYRKRVIRTNGDVLPTFLVDGFVAGTWRLEGERVKVQPFRRLEAPTRRQLDEEGERLAAFHA